MPRILFIATHRPNRSPSQRFRFEQYLDFLKQNGFDYRFSYSIREGDDKILYGKGRYLKKFFILLKTLQIRFSDWLSYKHYDIIFVQREAVMIGSTFFERKIKRTKARFVFDFDDSIWLMDTSEGNKKFEWMKNPEKTARNIRYADMVFAGNNYLADYARHYNKNIKIIPTTIDTEQYKPVAKTYTNKPIVIGWSGSITTIKHFEFALDFLKEVKNKYGDKISISLVGDGTYTNEELGIKGLPWIAEKELSDLNSFDIGIMPLPDDEWAKGKCGLKGLQYMALEIPTIMSPVGVNTEIIEHGKNGFLASTTQEWVDCLSQLIESIELRQKTGKTARQTVIEKYSVQSLQARYLEAFREVLK
ncbi:MAG TPA: glycosyltransferase family 4 protein [Bacteroidia bacterium]|jgi:glycosyltransferase involved in cell wall biosynthesis|nr:glycosyltransferase family 4 protein [Bacteroidia bacterium]